MPLQAARQVNAVVRPGSLHPSERSSQEPTIFASLLTLLAVALGVPAAPVPKDDPSPTAKALVGTWRFKSDEGMMPPWGTAVVTFTPDGKLTATFNMPGGGTGLFVDMAGTYRVSREKLTTAFVQGKGTQFERKREDVLTVTEISPTQVRMVYQTDEKKRGLVLERVKSEKESPNPGK